MFFKRKRRKTAIVVHIYHWDVWQEIATRLKQQTGEYALYLTLDIASSKEKLQQLKKAFPAARIRLLPNKGMDILPFLSLIPELINSGYQQVLKLHTKKGTTEFGDIWRQNLLDALLSDSHSITNAESAFKSNLTLKLLGPAAFFLSGKKLMLENQAMLDLLCNSLLDKSLPDEDWGFFAGSMFWSRPQIWQQLAHWVNKHQDLFCETYHQDGLLVHAIERYFGLACYQYKNQIGLLHPSFLNEQQYVLQITAIKQALINQVSSQRLCHSYARLESNYELFQLAGLINNKQYQDFLLSNGFEPSIIKKIDLIKHYWLIGQFSRGRKYALAWDLHCQNSHISWQKLVDKQRVKDLISIVIPVYGQLELTKLCVQSLHEYTQEYNYEVILVDNGSDSMTTNGLVTLTHQYSKLRLIKQAENKNFALGSNLGFAEAKGEYSVFLNNDTQVTSGWLAPLIARIKQDDVYAAQPQLLYPDGTIQCIGVVFSEHSNLGYPIYQGLEPEHCNAQRPREFQAITAACMAIKSRLFAQVKGFDPIYINGQEDIDLCLRLKALTKKKAAYVPESKVFHHESKTIGRGLYINQNRYVFYKSWFGFIFKDDELYYNCDGLSVDFFCLNENVDPKIRTLSPGLITNNQELKKMTYKKQTYLQEANKAFQNKDYEYSLELYHKSIKENNLLLGVVEFNINLTNKRRVSGVYSGLSSLNVLKKPDFLEEYYFDKIVESELFDPVFYTKKYPTKTKDVSNLLEHFLIYGVKDKLNPSSGFNTAHYLKANPDVAAADICPFIHYVCNGRDEGREAVPKPYKSRYSVSPVEYIPRSMEEATSIKTSVRTICFYLPQFHAIPENNEWWGEGFTEWTNVKPASAQFEGHYQPHVPHEDIGYYNLLDRDTQAKQIELAKQYGIEGFCYYLYWFSGQRLLEQPLDNMLADPTLDFPFCVCWANENWSRRWDGKDQDLLMVQDYSDEDDLAFIENIAKYLRDERYIRIDGKPLLLVYRPNLFPDMKATSKRWRNWCIDNGIGEIYLAYPQSFETVDPAEYDFDAAIEFPPNNSKPPLIIDQVEPKVEEFESTVYDWRVFVERSDEYVDPGYKLFRSATPSWDNTARKKSKGTVFHNSCPKLFEHYLTNAFKETLLRRENPDERIVFINAWNEWAEGAHLEPDQKYGYAWLQAVKNAHENLSKEKKSILIVSHDAHPHGAQILCLNFAKYFSEYLNFDVQMIVLGDGIMLDKYRQYATVQQINLQYASDEEINNVIEKVKIMGAKSAIVNTTVSGLITPYLKKSGLSVISLIHELPSVLEAYELGNHAIAIANNADQVIFPANQVQQGFEKFIGRTLDQARIRPQGAYLPSLLREGVKKEDIREKIRNQLGLPSDAKIVMCAGYADHRKGFDYFVKAITELAEHDSHIYGLWVGHRDQNFVDNSLMYAKAKGKMNHIIFTGLVDDPREYYIAADVYALTSREDPFPSVVMEALDALTPVVAFKDCGGFENLLQRECGILVTKDDIDAYTSAIKTILLDPVLSIKLATTGQKIVQTELSFYHYLYDLLEYAQSPLPRVSVVVPNYNYAKYITSRLDSILNQTFPIYEMIVLDDVSTDNSVEVIQNYLQGCKIPYRLVVNEKNSGSVFKQWQKGAELAQGDYLWIAEADDLAEPNFISTIMAEDHNFSLAYTDSKQIDEYDSHLADNYRYYYDEDMLSLLDESGIFSGREVIDKVLSVKNQFMNVSSMIFKTQHLVTCFDKHMSDILKFKVAGDWFIYVQALSEPEAKCKIISKSLNIHRRHSASVTRKNYDVQLNEIKSVHNICSNIGIYNETRQKNYLSEVAVTLDG
ncbi:glycoside hydrolase family 99-like domain-containing protein [Vibrio metschnikovii]|uniref:glycoside hydrolase family 99-like domain-containing protein n=1 Tax=Vibrio metschnikovii TaxID=28172 RepID=UPI001C2F7552|nr:glycoside hydrolase family 99-like domain-containing protein [Vibrio metschnikovii]